MLQYILTEALEIVEFHTMLRQALQLIAKDPKQNIATIHDNIVKQQQQGVTDNMI